MHRMDWCLRLKMGDRTTWPAWGSNQKNSCITRMPWTASTIHIRARCKQTWVVPSKGTQSWTAPHSSKEPGTTAPSTPTRCQWAPLRTSSDLQSSLLSATLSTQTAWIEPQLTPPYTYPRALKRAQDRCCWTNSQTCQDQRTSRLIWQALRSRPPQASARTARRRRTSNGCLRRSTSHGRSTKEATAISRLLTLWTHIISQLSTEAGPSRRADWLTRCWRYCSRNASGSWTGLSYSRPTTCQEKESSRIVFNT